MFRHHGTGSRRLHHDLPGETGRITLPPLWTGTMLAHQPPGEPAPTGTPPPAQQPGAGGQQPPAVTFTPEQQAAMDRIISDRLDRDRAARPAAPPNLAELQEQARQFQALQASAQTDQQRAAAEALAQGTTAGRQEMLPALVAARIAAASAGRLTVEQAEGIVAPLNPAYFLGEGGVVDQAKVAAYVASLPVAGPSAPGQAAVVFPGLGQGGNGNTPPPAKGEAGRAEARKRFGDPPPKTTT